MAKYDVKFACGHVATVELFGREKDRDKRKDYYSKYCVCPTCLEAEHDKDNATAKEKSNAMGLPDLDGTPKQIAWATTIRQKFFDWFGPAFDDAKKLSADNPYDFCAEMNLQKAEIVWDTLTAETSAKYWIDTRNVANIDRVRDILRKKEKTA